MVWDLDGAGNGTEVRHLSTGIHGRELSRTSFQVVIYENPMPHAAWRIWKLLPVNVEGVLAPSQQSSGTPGLGFPPSYDGDATRQSSTRAQYTESNDDGFGTIVNEVTVVTTTNTVTTHKRYRVEDA